MLYKIQQKLERLYGLLPLPDVRHFLISRHQVQNISPHDRPQVLLINQADEAQIGVYLGPDIDVHALNDIDVHNQNQYAIVAEEISHYLFVSWRLLHDQELSLLDIEVQGEIDKFFLFADRQGFDHTTSSKVFNRSALRPDLEQEEKHRYKKAHLMGSSFVRKLLLHRHSRQELLSYLRTFYRKSSITRISELKKIAYFMNRKKLVGLP